MAEVRLHHDARMLGVTFDDGTRGHYPYIWLRDNDPAGFHPDAGERLFDLTSVDPDSAPTAARRVNGAVEVEWPGASAPSRFDLDWLRAHRPGRPMEDPAAIAPRLWRAELGAAGIPRAEAAAILGSEAGLADWMRATKRVGLSIVSGLEDRIDAGTEVAQRIGFLRQTNFGTTFEVVSIPRANNLAYTALGLPLHTDLPNQELPPGYQFLHCLANDAEGGESVFADGFALAEDLRAADPKAFELLSTVGIPFRFHDADTDIRVHRPVIRLDRDGKLSELSWNAHIASFFDMEPEVIEPYYRAYQRFMRMTQDPGYRVDLKLEAGEMVVFDNRRVLHGRAAFDPSTGHRHLHGCYVDRVEFDSRLRVLARHR